MGKLSNHPPAVSSGSLIRTEGHQYGASMVEILGDGSVSSIERKADRAPVSQTPFDAYEVKDGERSQPTLAQAVSSDPSISRASISPKEHPSLEDVVARAIRRAHRNKPTMLEKTTE